MSRTVLSLTTLPGRIQKLRPVVECLNQQTACVDAILVNVPHRLRRSGQRYQIPAWLPRQPLVQIRRCTDYGPATKLLGALEAERNPDCVIITVDDDVLYPPSMVESYLHYQARYGPHVYCSAGFNILDPEAYSRDVRQGRRFERGHLRQVHVAEGYGSVAYRRGFFDDDIFEISNLPDFLLYSDDLFISNYLGGRRVAKLTVETAGFGGDGFWKSRLLPFCEDALALHRDQGMGSNRTRYRQAIRYLLDNRQYFYGSGQAAGGRNTQCCGARNYNPRWSD